MMFMRIRQRGIIVQLFLSYLIVGMFTATCTVFLAPMHLHALALIADGGLIGGLIGLLLTFNMQRAIHHVDRILVCLAQGQPIEQLETGWFWPLNTLFTHALQLNDVMKGRIERESFSVEQRTMLLQRVSEAAAQEERNRLARELHDSIKQQIFSIGMSAAAIEARLTGGLGTIEMPLADIQQSVEAAQSELEALVQQLRPTALSMSGMIESLRTQCQALAYRINGQATVEVGILPDSERLALTTGDALQRIVQEALSNIARHARAHNVRVSISQQSDELLVEIHDDGQGFVVDEATHGMGLANMRARADALGGSLSIQSRPGRTTISLILPLLALAGPWTERRKAVERQTRWTRTLLEGVEIFLQLTGVCILLELPFALVGAGLCLTLLCYCLAYYGRKRIVQLVGASSKEALALSSRGYDSAIGLWLLFGIAAWYLPVALQGRAPLLLTGLATALSLVAFVLVLRATWKYQVSLVAYVGLLSIKERGDEGKQRLRQMWISFGTWLAIVILALFIGQFKLTFPPQTAAQWSNGAIVALLILWPLFLLVNYMQNRFLIHGAVPVKKKERDNE